MSETDAEARERLGKLATKNTIEIINLKREVDFLKDTIEVLVLLINDNDRLSNEN